MEIVWQLEILQWTRRRLGLRQGTGGGGGQGTDRGEGQEYVGGCEGCDGVCDVNEVTVTVQGGGDDKNLQPLR